jgi:hypothetical protein
MKLEIYEILEKAAAAPTRVEKIEVLKKYNSLALRDILRAAYDDFIEFNLPPGVPEYKTSLSKEGMSPTSLQRQTTMMTYFVKKGKGDTLPAVKRERMFLQVLEGIHPKDAEILVAVKEKKFAGKYKGITKALVQEVWPTLIAV